MLNLFQKVFRMSCFFFIKEKKNAPNNMSTIAHVEFNLQSCNAAILLLEKVDPIKRIN